MKLTTFATTLLALTFGTELASAACCNVKVCDGFNLKGNCKNGCYPYRQTVKVNRSGLKSSVGSAKTDTDCFCTLGKDARSCMTVRSGKKGYNAPNHCLTGINNIYCQTLSSK